MKKSNRNLLIVIVAIILGALTGIYTGMEASVFGISFYTFFDLIGSLFINALMLIVVPLVASSIITSISRFGKERSFAKFGGKTLGIFITINILAIAIGFFLVLIFAPFLSQSAETFKGTLLTASPEGLAVSSEPYTFFNLILRIIPPSIVDVFSGKNMLSLIFFSIIFGYALSRMDHSIPTALKDFWTGIFHVMIQITHLLIKILPLGVFCLVAKHFAQTGISSLKPLSLLFSVVMLGFFIYGVFFLPFVLKVFGRVSPLRHLKAMFPALVTAFSTSSSAATLPVTLDCVEKRVGVSHKITSLVIPLGTSLNMAACALYAFIAAVFAAYVYNFPITTHSLMLIFVITVIASLGIAAIPAGGLVTILVIIKTIGLPAEAIAIFIAIDRIVDMFRTSLNVFTCSTSAILVARTEGEKNILLEKTPGSQEKK